MMKVWSESFEDGGTIPSSFAFCKADSASRVALSTNRNPHLAWADVPAGTRSFALIVADPDVPSRADDVNQEGRVVAADLPRVEFVHWLLFDLPADLRAIDEASFSHVVTPRGKHGPMIAHNAVDGALHGLNGYTEWFAGDHDMAGDYYGYDGPCPPWNDTIVHRYVFTIHALSIDRLPIDGRVTVEAARSAMRGNVLAEAGVTGLYSLNAALVRQGAAAS